MPGLAVDFHPAAADEMIAAERWYRKRSPGAANHFRSEVEAAVERISSRPEAGGVYAESFRRALLHSFPFFLVYRILPARIEVVAVAHARRRPGYWRER